MKNIVLEINDLTVAYQQNPVLWDIDLDIYQGSMFAIVGPNGSGKTTLIKSIMGIIKPISGTIDIKGLTHKNIAYVPQLNTIDWDFPATVLDIVMMGRYGHLGWFKRPGKKEKELALEALKTVNMHEYAKRQISQLSGGQQQRVFLARALVQQADIYLMDEPFKGVDVQSEKAIFEILQTLKKENKTIIVVHHDLDTVKQYFDYAAILNVQIVAYGKVEDIFNDTNLKKAYSDKKILK